MTEKYGRLTFIREAGRSKGGHILWDCLCDCGKTLTIPASRVKNGGAKSCGCLRAERVSASAKHRAEDLAGLRFARLTVLHLAEREEPKTHRKWVCICDCGNLCKARTHDLKRGHIKSCGCLAKEYQSPDFFATSRVVQGTLPYYMTSKKLSKANTSGVRGVSFRKNRNSWYASIDFQNVNYYLGYYKNKEDAIKARALAEEKIVGPFLEWYENEWKGK